MTGRISFILRLLLINMIVISGALAQNNDDEYAKKIREYTTDERFLNELVDHLPDSPTVPSPLKYFGEIIGAPGILHYTEEIYSYFRTLDEASPRVQVRSIGKTEEGREMIEVIVSDEENLSNLETYREYLN
ncbi:MAG: peptidase, partial [Calditrichaeota bacterium]